MTERETVLLGEFKEKIDKLIRRCETLKSENQRLRDEQIHLHEQIRLLSHRNEELAEKNEQLKFAKSLLASDGQSHDARIKINRIVREIDKCIALLNK